MPCQVDLSSVAVIISSQSLPFAAHSIAKIQKKLLEQDEIIAEYKRQRPAKIRRTGLAPILRRMPWET